MKKVKRNWVADFFIRHRKLFRIMKLTLVLLLAGLVTFATETYSQATKLTMKMENATIQDVFNEIESISEFRIAYNNSKLDASMAVNIDVKDQTVDKILDAILSEMDLRYEIVDRYIVITDKPTPAVSGKTQQKTVKGNVTNTQGEPLPGVTILIKGTTNGVVTDVNGNFSLAVSENDKTLVFSFVGMQTQEIEIGSQQEFSVVLKDEMVGIDEVVVVGYGTQKKVNLTGSISTLDSRLLTDKPITQTSQALQGRMPGVTVTSSFAMPGEDGATIRIRGIGTLGNNNPLVLVDGIEGSINDINPQDIENISVLKDAASASIYGSRAAGGVILIKTKRGNSNEKLTVTYNGSFNTKIPTRLPEIVDGETFMLLRNEVAKNAGTVPTYSEQDIEIYRQNVGTEPYFDTDWFAESMKEMALTHQHSISVKGGSEKIASMVSASYLDQDALIENSGFKRMSVRSNTNFTVNDKLTLFVDAFLRSEETKQATNGNSTSELFGLMFTNPAIFPAMWSDGSIGEGWQGDNPIGYIKAGNVDIDKSSRVLLNFKAEYSLTDWLSAEFTYSPKFLGSDGVSKVKHFTYKRIDGSTGTRPNSMNGMTYFRNHSNENFYQTILRFNKTFNNHNLSALAGFESIDYHYEEFNATRQNFLLPEYEVLDAGDSNFQTNGGNATEWALASLFGRINYSLKEKYLFEANIRYDGSSRFASDKRWSLFPSLSAGWRISEEDFMKSIDKVTNLKLRVSWGELGNQLIGNYPYMGLISLEQPYYFGKQAASGAAQTVFPNNEVTWETTRELDFGIDFAFFDGRINGTVDYYNKNTRNILYRRDIPLLTGLSASEQNIAEVENKGWDFQLGWNDKLNDFNYGISVVLSDVKNKVLDLAGKPQYGLNAILEGEEYRAYYGYECIGIYRTQEDLDTYPKYTDAVGLGDLIFKDQNSDGKIDPLDDKKVIGSSIPRFNFGASINLAYKGFDFEAFLQGVGKKNVYFKSDNNNNFPTYILNRFIPDDPATHETATWIRLGPQTQNRQDNSFYLYNAAYVRCKFMTLGYTFPTQLIKKAGIGNLRFYITAENLFTIDKLDIKIIDPEAPNSSSGTSYYPMTKSFSLGVELKF